MIVNRVPTVLSQQEFYWADDCRLQQFLPWMNASVTDSVAAISKTIKLSYDIYDGVLSWSRDPSEWDYEIIE